MHGLLIVYIVLAWLCLFCLGVLPFVAVHGKHIEWRRMLFGWRCKRRGFHASRKPTETWNYVICRGFFANYRCLCGSSRIHYSENSLLPTDFSWRDGE